MRVLVCHSRYRSGPASGENRVVDDEVGLLRSAGHVVETFMPLPHADGAMDLIRLGVGTLWNRAAGAELTRLVKEHRPDVIHMHNLFPALSPAVLRLEMQPMPAVVMTLHNHRLLCLPGTFVREGKICLECLERVPWRGVLHRCYQESTLGSAALATSLSLHRIIATFKNVDRFLAISASVKEKHVQAGFDPRRILVKQHFAWPSQRRRGPGQYFLYLGRLSEEKGVGTLLRAWPGQGGRLVVAGTGPEERALRSMSAAGVEFLGLVREAEATRLVGGARCVVVPSISYEGAGRVVLEAYAAGVPVIASDIGGLPEVVEHDVSGLLVPPSNEADLRRAIERMQEAGESERMGQGAFEAWSTRHRPELALADLEASYAEAIAASSARR